jgi:PAS domain S-box-containing protein
VSSLNPVVPAPMTGPMSMHIQPLSALPQLRGLLEVTRLVREERDLTLLVDGIAATIADSLGFRTVAINLYRPAEGDFMVTTVHGSDAARELLLGATRHADAWDAYFVERFLRRGAYLIPRGEGDWEGVTFHVPELEVSSDPDAWHPDDALMVPMRGADGTLLGVVSVDEPESGLLPTDEELDVLVAFAGHVIAAIEGVQAASDAARDRASLAQLLDVSASLVELESADDVLQAVAQGIKRALEFEKVAVCLARDGRLSPSGTAGWEPGDPGLDFTFDQDDLDVLFVPEFEIEGCYLIENDIARSLVPDGSTYSSERGGAGPRAWSHHWLLVPLIERDGSRSGFIWVDDPADAMLPSRERLQALRTFANQATMALRAAVDFETLNARNSELAALHGTAVGLLERLDLDSVLTAIMQNACSLVGTPHGYLALVDAETDQLQTAVKLGLLERVGPAIAARGEGIAGRVWETNSTIAVEDYASWDGRADGFAESDFHATVGVPLRAGGEVVGVIGLAYAEPGRTFGPGEVALIERFAQLAALALENARLYTAAQRELDERRAAEEALRRSERLHRHVVEDSTDLIALLDAEARILLASKAYDTVLGYPPASLIGTPLADLLHPDDLAAVRAQAVDRAVVDPVAARLRARDGRWVLVEGISTPIRGETGEIELILVIARDVTERHRLEEQLRQAQKMESIGRLAGGIAHDFNNLLTAISGYAELILMDFDAGAAQTRDSAEQIARAAGRAASLTGQLLAFSRKQVLRPQVIDLNEVVGGMAAMLARMLGEDVVLSTALDPELGPALADPTQIEQVVLNLALNSRDAMPNGGSLVVLTAPFELGDADERPHPNLEPGSYVTLAVRDTGVGIAPDVIENVFEPFFTTKPVGEGTGLGLATVHGIVSQSGGVTWVESSPGAGTTVTVCLPRVAE